MVKDSNRTPSTTGMKEDNLMQVLMDTNSHKRISNCQMSLE